MLMSALLHCSPIKWPFWYVQVVNIRIHYSRKLKELSDKLAESKNEQSKLKVAVDNAAQLKKIPPNRTIKVRVTFEFTSTCQVFEVLSQKYVWISGLVNGITNTGLSGGPRLCI